MKHSKFNQTISPFLKRLDLLKAKLLTETDFRKIYNYFLDNLGEDSEFREIGKAVKRPVLKRLAAQVGKEITGTGRITHLILIKVPQYPFLHGPLFVDGCMSQLIFFEDINVGLMALALPNMETHLARLTAMTEEEFKTLKTIN